MIVTTTLLTFLYLTTIKKTEAVCNPYTVCTESRNKIILSSHYSNNLMSYRNDVTWFIRPMQQTRSLVLVFRKFHFAANVRVLVIKEDGSLVLYKFEGGKGMKNFQIINDKIREVMIVATKGPLSSFILEYYSDCGVIKTDSMHYPSQDNDDHSSCWLFNLHMANDDRMQRMYVTMRNVYLDPSYSIKMTDVSTMEQVFKFNGNSLYEVFGFDTVYNRTLMLELTCFKKDFLETTHNSFIFNYYKMDEKDVACVEIQKQCRGLNENIKPKICQTTCDAMERMLKNEINIEEGSQLELRSGYRASKSNNKMSTYFKIRRRENNKLKGISTCRLKPQYCQCPKSVDITKFCQIKERCFEIKETKCIWACFWIKMYNCGRIKQISAGIKLL